MSGKISVTVETVPVQGTATTKTVEVEESGASLREVLSSAGMTGENRALLVNGKPATLDTYVGPDANVKATEVKVQVSERPRGS